VRSLKPAWVPANRSKAVPTAATTHGEE
jgi:hypothetical protein